MKAVYILIFSFQFYAFSQVEFKELIIDSERNSYLLDFNTTYVTYVNPGIELLITLPDEYIFSSTISGLHTLVRAVPIRNRMTVTFTQELPDKELVTNLNFFIICPDKNEKELVFKIICKRNVPRVFAIHFYSRINSELNKAVERMKVRYTNQLNQALSEQEKSVEKKSIQETIANAMPFFIKAIRGSLKVEYNGAVAYLDGIINSYNDTYIYIRTFSFQENCDIIRLIKAGNGNKNGHLSDAELFNTIDNGDRSITYVYRIPGLQIKKVKGKEYAFENIRCTLVFLIWSKLVIKTLEIS